jgi:mRNA interferase MazF
MTEPTCHRGEVWLVNFDPGRGSEQRGTRPALILQNDIGNQYASTTIVAAITRTRRLYPVTVFLEPPDGGLSAPSMVNLGQLLTITKQRLMHKLGVLSQDSLHKVDAALAVSIGLRGLS